MRSGTALLFTRALWVSTFGFPLTVLLLRLTLRSSICIFIGSYKRLRLQGLPTLADFGFHFNSALCGLGYLLMGAWKRDIG